MKIMIWSKEHHLEDINVLFSRYMTGFLDIRASKITPESLHANMPITEKVLQP